MNIIVKIFELLSRAAKMNENLRRITREHDMLSGNKENGQTNNASRNLL